MYFESDDGSQEAAAELLTNRFLTRSAVVLMAVLIVLIGLFSSPLLQAVQKSVLNLL
jgi:hypothetical protein